MKILTTVPGLITALSMGAPPFSMTPGLRPGGANNPFAFALPHREPTE
ncbi:MAG: hypothetical protein OXF98_02385 [Rhodospirillaceae bacterium]|nr:hypothetical protein [Rhodospirillaceae bacterium]